MVNNILQDQMNNLNITENTIEEPVVLEGTDGEDVLQGGDADDTLDTTQFDFNDKNAANATQLPEVVVKNGEEEGWSVAGVVSDIADVGLEIKQGAAEFTSMLGSGFISGSQIYRKAPPISGFMGNVLDLVAEHTGAGAKVLWNAAFKQEWDSTPWTNVEGMSERFNPIGDVFNMAYENKYLDVIQDGMKEDWENTFRVKDMPVGVADKMYYYSGFWLGEILSVPAPIWGTASKQAAKKVASMTPSAVTVNAFVKSIREGKHKLSDIKNFIARDIVKKELAASPWSFTRNSHKVKHGAYQAAKTLQYHSRDALNMSAGAGLASTAAYTLMVGQFGFDEKTANELAPLFGLTGMFTGIRPAVWATKKTAKFAVGYPLKLTGKFISKQFPSVTKPFDEVAVRFSTHLWRSWLYKQKGDVDKERYHTLRYLGADHNDALAMQFDEDMMIPKHIKQRSLDDAMTFWKMLENMAAKDPEFLTYIENGRKRVLQLQKQFKNVFAGPDSVEGQRLQKVFEDEIREMNAVTKNFDEKQIKEIVKGIDITDLPMFLDQVFMLDFLSGIRNMTATQATLKTVSAKEQINLINESFRYNQVLDGQVTIIKAALKSLMKASNKSDQALTLINDIEKTVAQHADGVVRASDQLEQFATRAIKEAELFNENKYHTTLERLLRPFRHVESKIVRHGQLELGDLNATKEERAVRQSTDRLERHKADTMSGFAAKYAELGEVILDGSPLLDNLTSEILERSEIISTMHATTKADKTLRGGNAFKYNVRNRGLFKKYNLNKLNNIDNLKLTKYTQNISREIKDLHRSLTDVDDTFFAFNKQVDNLSVPNSKTRVDRIVNRQNNPETAVNEITYREDLIKALVDDLDDVASLDTSVAAVAQVEKYINLFTKPLISAQEAHGMAKNFYGQARRASDMNDKRELNKLGHQIMESMEDPEGAIARGAMGDMAEEYRQVSKDYRKQIVDVYYSGAGKKVMKALQKANDSDPASIGVIFQHFITRSDPALAVKQFKAMFPEGPKDSPTYKMREKAVDQLNYALGNFIAKKGVTKLSGGDFSRFSGAFKEILDDEVMNTLRKANEHITTQKVKRQQVFKVAKDKINNALKTLDASSVAAIKKSAMGEIAERGTITYDELVDLVTRPSIGKKLGQVSSAEIGIAKRDIRKAIEETGDVPVSAEASGYTAGTGQTKAGRTEQLLEASTLPERTEAGMLNAETVSLLLREAPSLREPLRDIAVQHIIDQSFVPMNAKRFNERTGTLTLAEDLSIVEFGEAFHKNLDTFKKLFSEDEVSILQMLFETSVATQAKNTALRIMNIPRDPTTSSRASRLFALQRKVVGLPYLTAEQIVMTWQRDKADFLRRLVTDPDIALLAKNLIVDGKITKSNLAGFATFTRALYNKTMSEEDLNFVSRKLHEDWAVFGKIGNYRLDIKDAMMRKLGMTSEEASRIFEMKVDELKEEFEDFQSYLGKAIFDTGMGIVWWHPAFRESLQNFPKYPRYSDSPLYESPEKVVLAMPRPLGEEDGETSELTQYGLAKAAKAAEKRGYRKGTLKRQQQLLQRMFEGDESGIQDNDTWANQLFINQ